ncbi:MAG: FAD-binding oxidoreductase, partial [Pseudomonadota bacterium]|nr:FAD-binding oxidoreductase [Pseudomonadota bacterium]
MTLNSLDDELAQRLRAALPEGILRDVEPRYLSEPRDSWPGQAGLVALPRSVDEVAAVVRAAGDLRIGIIPYGGGTGLVSGQVMPKGPLPLVLSLERMNRVRAVFPEENVLIAEAGVILADVQAAAEEVGRLFPLSLASEGSCRVGG